MNHGPVFTRIMEPGNIGRMRLKNRITMAAMGTHFVHDGRMSSPHAAYFVERAKGDVGLITTEATTVNTRLCGFSGTLRMDSDEFMFGHGDLTDHLHAYGSKVCMQLYHPGRHNNPELNGGQNTVAPSPVPETVPQLAARPGARPPRELTLDEVYELIDSFGAAAARARAVGYDAVEIHGAHGYLVHQFMSPHTNRRTDAFGGSPENRMRFPVLVIKSIKQNAGRDLPVIFRMTAEETMAWPGYVLADAEYFARQVEAAGADAIHVTMGTFEDADGVSRNACPMSYAQGWRLPYIEAVKKQVRVPVIGVGAFREPEFVESVLAQGKADFVALGRQLLADAFWVKKAAAGRPDLIRKCTSCNYCLGRLGRRPLHCCINPVTGRELDLADLRPALTRKRVMVIGSGPGGMEAARIAARRGHQVALYEKEDALGAGQLALAAVPPRKERMNWVREYLTAEVRETGVEVHLNTEVTPGLVEKAAPDVAIVATGAGPSVPDIPGARGTNVVHAHDVLAGRVKIEGQRVAVLGQYVTGAETADFLAEKGNRVAIVARSPMKDLARGSHAATRFDLVDRLRRNKNVTILNGWNCREIRENGICIVDRNWKETFLEVDRVVLAQGVAPANELAEQLRGRVPEVYTIGDAADPRDMGAAIYEGTVIARNV